MLADAVGRRLNQAQVDCRGACPDPRNLRTASPRLVDQFDVIAVGGKAAEHAVGIQGMAVDRVEIADGLASGQVDLDFDPSRRLMRKAAVHRGGPASATPKPWFKSASRVWRLNVCRPSSVAVAAVFAD